MPYGGAPYQPYQSPPVSPGAGSPFRQSHSGATTGMVLGIVSIVAAVIGTCACGFLGGVGVLLGPFGIWQSLKARREIDADPDRYDNRGHAATGLVCGIVGTVLGALVLVGSVALLLLVGLSESSTY